MNRQAEADRHALNRLERLLQPFAEVRAGEGATALLMFVNIFLVLTAYYVLKVVREALTIGGVTLGSLQGDEIKAYLPAIMALLLIVIVPVYGRLASKVDRMALIRNTMLFVIAVLCVFFVWGSATGVGTSIGLSFYISLGIINVFLIAQFWSYANDIYTEAQGKRLFAIIAVGQSLGAVLGPKIAQIGAEHTFGLLALSAALLLICLFLFGAVNRRVATTSTPGSMAPRIVEPLAKEGGFQLVFGTRYLLLIALMILCTNMVNTTGEYILSNAALQYAEQEVSVASVLGPDAAAAVEGGASLTEDQRQRMKDERSPFVGRFYGEFFFYVNLAGLLIQLFFVSRIFRFFGIRAALFVLPVLAFGGYAAIGTIGGLAVLRVAKTAENSTDYSLQNTVKQALFLPTSREAKYKAKQAIDTFFVRFGDAASAGIVALGLHVLHFDAKGFAFVNVGLCLLWIGLCAGIAREHKKLETSREGANNSVESLNTS